MKHRRLWSLLVAGMLLAMVTLSGCGGEDDPNENGYNTREDAISAVTQANQEIITQIEARDGKVIVVWSNITKDASAPFSLGLLEETDGKWKITDKDSAAMTDKFNGAGMYPTKDGLIDYAVSPSEDDPIRDSYAEHESANNWTFHWSIVPELPV